MEVQNIFMNDDFKILYAEDEEHLREVMTELLAVGDCKIYPVANGFEAIALLEKQNFDLVISDFQMPKMNGAELLFWCREHDLHMPFIFLSGNIDRLPVEDVALEDCCTTRLIKPVSIEKLLEAIDQARDRNHAFECHKIKVTHDKAFKGQHIHPN